MAFVPHTTPTRLNPSWVPAPEPLGMLEPFFNRRGPSAANSNTPKPKGDPWAAMIAACSPWPRVQAHAWQRRSQGWTVAEFAEEGETCLTRLMMAEPA